MTTSPHFLTELIRENMFAWVTLLTQPDYLVGVKALHHSLKQSNSQEIFNSELLQ